MFENVIANLISGLTTQDTLVLVAAALALAEAALHWVANHYDGVDVTGPLKWVIRLAAFAKKLTPGGLGREVAKRTNPESLGAKDHAAVVKTKLAGEIAAHGKSNGAPYNAI
jgi:hypothetical protein